jgi:hypothetical protein
MLLAIPCQRDAREKFLFLLARLAVRIAVQL